MAQIQQFVNVLNELHVNDPLMLQHLLLLASSPVDSRKHLDCFPQTKVIYYNS